MFRFGESLLGLGTSITKAIDIDDNGFNDFAVGAANSANVIVFRYIRELCWNS
jgi:hypothetical protein